jgi:hypothetical protein
VQYEMVCDRICDDIATILLEMKPTTRVAAYAAARATRDVADAFYHAAGDPVSPRWREAIESVERFLNYTTRFVGVRHSKPFYDLSAFVHENADLLRAA